MSDTTQDINSLVMDAFPTLKAFSPSSLNKWSGDYSDEGLWCLSYLYRKRFQGSPASIRGQVVEEAFYKILLKEDEGVDVFLDRAFRQRVEELEDYDNKSYEKELKGLSGFLEQAYRSIQELQLVLPKRDNETEKDTQLKIEIKISDKVPLKLRGYLDFDFGDYAMDLKTTNAIPRKGIKPDHKEQISSYAKAREDKIAKILYLSSKDYQAYSMDDREIKYAYSSLVKKAESLWDRLVAATVLSMYNDSDPKIEFTKLVTPNINGWAWGDDDVLFAVENNLWGYSAQ